MPKANRYPVAHMESKGPWYDPVVIANAILGQRGIQAKQLSYKTIQGQIETNLWPNLESAGQQHAPTPQTTRKWAKNQANYPEKAIKNGLVAEDQLLPWAKEQLLRPAIKPAAMSQSRRVVIGGVGIDTKPGRTSSRKMGQGPFLVG